MLIEDLRDPAHIVQAETTIAVNLLGTIRVVDAFAPHLIERGGGDIITVSSGIGFMPFLPMPTYGASKAGVRAYTESLRPHTSAQASRSPSSFNSVPWALSHISGRSRPGSRQVTGGVGPLAYVAPIDRAAGASSPIRG